MSDLKVYCALMTLTLNISFVLLNVINGSFVWLLVHISGTVFIHKLPKTKCLQEVKSEAMGAAQKSMPLDPSIYGQAILKSKSGGSGAASIVL